MKDIFPTPNIFADIPGLFFAFSSRNDGDMREKNPREDFLLSHASGGKSLLTMDQVHGAMVTDTTGMDTSYEFPKTDGLVRKDTSCFLGVRVADCVPIFAVDPKGKVFGVCHAGWKGVQAKIVVRLLSAMAKIGADRAHIRLFVGPHICSSCYAVAKDRAEKFQSAYKNGVVRQTSDGKYFLDLAKAIRMDCLSEGIPEDHMEASEICTSCGRWASYSFRKNGGHLDGKMMGVLGFI